MVKEAPSTVAMPFERSGPSSTMGGGGVSDVLTLDVMAETKVHVGVVSGRIGGRSCSSVEVPVGGGMVALISWVPSSEGETRVRRDGGGGVVNLAADLHEDIAQNAESPPLLRSEGLSVGSPEADSIDETVRAGFREELVAGVQ